MDDEAESLDGTEQEPGSESIANPQRKVVMFADLLGFAALTEKYELEIETLRSPDRLDTILGAVFNPLTKTFTDFHRAMIWTPRLSALKHSSTAITFSDSAFVATTRLHEAVGIAVYLMQSLLRSGVPARVGIAYGSFAAVRFRSDVTSDGGDHAAHFLGTGVVRANAAERCGIKGCRILLHPSVTTLLDDPTHNPPPQTSEHFMHLHCEASECQNSVGILSEVNYWSYGPTDEKAAWRGLQKMWDVAPQTEYHHYKATAEAINRMRMQRGEDSIADLRRRTVRRKRPSRD